MGGRVSAAVACALVFAAGARADLLGVAWDVQDSPVYRIDERTGTATLIGPSGVRRLNSLAAAPDGSLYSVGGVATAAEPENVLVRIDPNTGRATPVRNLSLPGRPPSVRALAFAPDGTLYAVNGGNASQPFDLFRIDVATGEGTRVGPILESLQAMDFAPDGTLYGYHVYQTFFPFRVGLVRIDPATGATTDVNPATPGIPGIQGIVFAPDGTLYGARDDLWRMDPATDTRQLVGHLGELDLRGIEVVPEPSAPAAALAGAALLLRRRRRRVWSPLPPGEG